MTLFPVQDGDDISWELAEKVHKGYVMLYGDIQSLERIRQRGGWGKTEVFVLTKVADGLSEEEAWKLFRKERD